MGLRKVIELGNEFRMKLREDIEVLRMEERNGKKLRKKMERGENIIVIKNKREIIGNEMIESVDEEIKKLENLVESEIVKEGDRNVERIIGERIERIMKKLMKRIKKIEIGIRKEEIEKNSSEEGKWWRSESVEIVGGICENEGNLKVGVRVDEEKNEIEEGWVDEIIELKDIENGGDIEVLDKNIWNESEVRSDEGEEIDEFDWKGIGNC